MPTPPDNVPWLAWAIVVVILALVAQIPALVQARHTKRDVKDIKDQVKNTHPTNLREDMDRTHAVASDAASDAKLAAESSHRTERLVEDLVKSIRAGEHSADRRDKLQGEALQEVREDLTKHLNEVPQILDDAFKRHAADCPRRSQPADQAV